MDEAEGARSFGMSGSTYDAFMGRYSRPLAELFADEVGVARGHQAVDVGCGPGALTSVLVRRLGVDQVRACDPSPSFREACAARHPGMQVLDGRAEAIPFASDSADHVLSQLVMHFVTDAPGAAREMARVARPGGTVAACVWDFAEGMQLLRAFWDAALTVDPDAPDEARTLRYGGPGEIADLLDDAGLADVREATLTVSSTYASFDELWAGFLGGVGPAGAWCVAQDEDRREQVRSAMFARVGSPDGPVTLGAVARCATATAP